MFLVLRNSSALWFESSEPRALWLKSLLVALLTTGIMATAPARASSQQAGIDAYEAGDYQQAREHFERAREAGDVSDSLMYNLAVTYYRLGDLERADALFARLQQSRHRALATYNRGLVALAGENHATARQWFYDVLSLNPPDALRNLAESQLERLSGKPAGRFHEVTTRVVAGAGYDSNVGRAPSAAPSGRGSQFADLWVESELAPLASRGLVWQVDAYGRRFGSATGFDQMFFQQGIGWRQPLEQGWLDLVGFGEIHGQGGDRIEAGYGFRLERDAMPCGLGVCRASWLLAHMIGGPEYREYDGWQTQLALDYRQAVGHGVGRLSVLAGVDRRRNFALLDEQGYQLEASVSPRWLGAELAYQQRLTERLNVFARAGYRWSVYGSEELWLSPSGEQLLAGTRRDQRWQLIVGGDWMLSRLWVLSADARLADNQSSLEAYRYQQVQYWVGLERQF